MGGAPRALPSSRRQRTRVGDAVRSAFAAGFAGVCLDRPSAPLTLGLLGAGFCSDCQRFHPPARARLRRAFPAGRLPGARARGRGPGVEALSFEVLPFGRDFWRARNDALERAVADYARSARDAARAAARQFGIVVQFDARRPRAAPRRPPRGRRDLPGAVHRRHDGARSPGCSALRSADAPPPSRPWRRAARRQRRRGGRELRHRSVGRRAVRRAGRGGGAGAPARTAARRRGALAARGDAGRRVRDPLPPPRRTSGPAAAIAPRSSAPPRPSRSSTCRRRWCSGWATRRRRR